MIIKKLWKKLSSKVRTLIANILDAIAVLLFRMSEGISGAADTIRTGGKT